MRQNSLSYVSGYLQPGFIGERALAIETLGDEDQHVKIEAVDTLLPQVEYSGITEVLRITVSNDR
jgi:hypothetical protein